ncbi:MAG: DUF342 domain-containing protein [Nitrosomonadales bacterium]|nr:DUF342 domain-containing protein [Nitrosomonadales bacterium]
MGNPAPPTTVRSDGKFSLHPATDLSALYLSYTLPTGGGSPVLPETVIGAAKSHGVTVELDVAAINKTLLEGGTNVRVGYGRAPVPGADGRFEILIDNMKKRSPHLDEHGLADFRDLGAIVTVKPGDPLMRIVEPAAGVPGLTVTGKEIPVKPGKSVSFPPELEGVTVAPADPHLLVAAIAGCPVVTKNGVMVEAICHVNNVDLHTGNITYDGGVHVAGDVHSGMTVKATGDIVVEGTVEDALLEAGGDVTVKYGIMGSEGDEDATGNKMHATIKCGGSCTVKFAQDAHIFAGNGIFIHEAAMQCELSAAHQIIVGSKGSSKGELIGGIARATMLVQARDIGSDDHPRTVVIVGNDKDLYERLHECNRMHTIADNKFADVLMFLGSAKKTPGKFSPETMAKAETDRVAFLAEIAEITAETLQIKKEIDLAQQAQVVAEKRVFAGAEIRIGQRHYEAEQDREGGVFKLGHKGELVFD